MDHVEAEGDTLDQAIAKALKLLGVGRDQAVIDVLSEPRKGVLGIGAKKARVRASLRSVTEESGEEPERREPPRQRNVDPADIAAAEAKSKAALNEILRLIGLAATVEAKRGNAPEEIVLEIQGDTGGLLGGRKGQVLEALHYLLTRIVAET